MLMLLKPVDRIKVKQETIPSVDKDAEQLHFQTQLASSTANLEKCFGFISEDQIMHLAV